MRNNKKTPRLREWRGARIGSLLGPACRLAPLQARSRSRIPDISHRVAVDSSRDEREDARAVHLPAHVAARLAPREERLRPVPCVCGSLARRVLSQSGSLEGYGNSRTHLYPCGGVPHCHVWYVGPSHLTARRLPVMTRSSRWVGRVLIYAGRYYRRRPARCSRSRHAQCIACDRVRACERPRVTRHLTTSRRLAWLPRYLWHVGIRRVQLRVKE